ncbi:MerR family DNA-binding transcriptional regulator, partial [Escherichia coli]|uniref:MerR family DNA-binding transcriptional regulator n=1 Tax=Escherichia coli TaxID=562 RepID=UPI000EF22820
MNIGQASKHSGITAKMIRYYEEIGLHEAAQRSASGYRIYSETALKPVNFLKQERE